MLNSIRFSSLRWAVISVFILPVLLTSVGFASESNPLELSKVTDNIYALLGPTEGRTYDNLALNNNMGFIVTGSGVILIDSGTSPYAAKMIESRVREVTDQPIRWVINTGSQDHRWMGNSYFKAKGAKIIALKRTVSEQKRHADDHLKRLRRILKDRADGVAPLHAPAPIDKDRAQLDLGGVKIELIWLGDAHFPGDAVVFLARQSVLFSGDLIYVERMLGVHPFSKVLSWQKAFHAMEKLSPKFIVPGHGPVTDLARAKRETGDYLDWIIAETQKALAGWKEIGETVDALSNAPKFKHLKHFKSWHRTNLNRVYLQLEAAQ